MTLLQGSNTATSKITFVDDSSDEGDEELLFSLDTLPAEYLVLNNNVKIRIVDNDFKVADFGTPIHSTYGKIKGTQSPTYYQSLNGKIGTALKPALQAIIADPALVRAQTYNDVINILMEADQNPENSNQVWLVYSEKRRAKLDLQTSSNNVNVWNREHTWPRSRGGFDSIEADETDDGKNIFWVTGPDSLRHANHIDGKLVEQSYFNYDLVKKAFVTSKLANPNVLKMADTTHLNILLSKLELYIGSQKNGKLQTCKNNECKNNFEDINGVSERELAQEIVGFLLFWNGPSYCGFKG